MSPVIPAEVRGSGNDGLTSFSGKRRLLELRCACSSGICGCTSFLRFLAQAFLFLPLADVHHLKRFSWWLRRSGSTFATIQSGILTFCSGHGTHRPWQDSLTAGG